jgi:hypothetical protein
LTLIIFKINWLIFFNFFLDKVKILYIIYNNHKVLLVVRFALHQWIVGEPETGRWLRPGYPQATKAEAQITTKEIQGQAKFSGSSFFNYSPAIEAI